MKKMICEICGSQSIRKENGVFVCQECGTEYSLEEAKNLLKDVDGSGESTTKPQEENKDKAFLTAPKEKDQLINVLHAWYEYMLSLERVKSFFVHLDLPAVFPRTVEMVNNAKIKYTKELLLTDFNRDTFKESERGTFINFYYKDFSLNKNLAATLPRFPFTYCLLANTKKYIDFIYKNLELIKKHTSFRTENIGPHVSRRYSSHCLVRSKKDKKCYLSINANLEDVNYLFEKAIKNAYFIDKIGSEDLELVVQETVAETGYIEEKTGLFKNKIVTKNINTSSTREYVPPFANEILSFFKSPYDYMKTLQDFYKEQYDYLESCLPKVKKAYAELESDKATYVKIFDLPERYRSSNAIASLIELLYIGRADSWKEAMNLYENDNYHAKVLGSLSAINSSLGRINTTLIQGFSYLGHKLDMTSQQLDKLVDNTNKSLELNSQIVNGIKDLSNKKEYIDLGLSIDVSTTIKVS